MTFANGDIARSVLHNGRRGVPKLPSFRPGHIKERCLLIFDATVLQSYIQQRARTATSDF